MAGKRQAGVFGCVMAAVSLASLFGIGLGTQAYADTIYFGQFVQPHGAVFALDVDTRVITTVVAGTGSGAGGNNIDFPTALAVGPQGDLFVGSTNNGHVVKISPGGSVSTFLTHPEGDTSGLSFDAVGNLYDVQIAFREVDKISPTGTLTLVASGLNQPQGGTFDPAGNFYVLTGETQAGANVMKITAAGAVSTFATGVTGLFWDAQGNVR